LLFGCHPSPQAEDLLSLLFLFAFADSHRGGICFCLLPLHLFFAFSAQKSLVKRQNHLTPSNEGRSSLKFSYPQTTIIKTVEKNRQAQQGYSGANSFVWTYLAVTPLL
jgi:hypothetical protein